MTAAKRNHPCFNAFVAALLAVAAAAPAVAAEGVQPWEAGLGIGIVDPGNKRKLDNGAGGILTLGHRFSERWGAELFGIMSSTEVKGSGADTDISMLGLRALYHFYDGSNAWTPYLSFGAGRTHIEPGANETSTILGAGIKRALSDKISLRAEINVHNGFDSNTTDLSAFLGLAVQWGRKSQPAPAAIAIVEPTPIDSDGDGVPDSEDKCPGTPQGIRVNDSGCPLDADGDGVPDYLDTCPATPAGAKVNDSGCPLDADGDGVPDYLDACPATPAGAKVNDSGCPLDSDGDGVPDYLDACPATPAGAKVNDSGCPLDSDGDGVPDYLDTCPATPAGAKVNDSGCPLDADGDGVPDYLDACPATPAGTKVNDSGCPLDSDGDGVPDYLDACPATPAGAKVNDSGCPLDADGDGVPDYLDKCPGTAAGFKVDVDGCTMKLTEKVRITLKLNFDTRKADIKPGFGPEIQRVADFMRQYPGTKVVIEGHTDNAGAEEYNRLLSQRRADAVANSLVRDHGIARDRVLAIGYGESRPIEDNKTPEGRAANRRVTAVIEETVTRELR